MVWLSEWHGSVKCLDIRHGFEQICHGLDSNSTYLFHLNIDSVFEALVEKLSYTIYQLTKKEKKTLLTIFAGRNLQTVHYTILIFVCFLR